MPPLETLVTVGMTGNKIELEHCPDCLIPGVIGSNKDTPINLGHISFWLNELDIGTITIEAIPTEILEEDPQSNIILAAAVACYQCPQRPKTKVIIEPDGKRRIVSF